MTIYFGPAGASESFYAQGHKSSLDMSEWLAKLGLNAYEYQSTRGVKIGGEMAVKLGQLASQQGIRLSMHAPYYINLAARDEEMKRKTKAHLLNALKAASLMGAKVVVFHPGSGSGGDRKEILAGAKSFLKEILNEAEAEGTGTVQLAPETMGKRNQLGSLEEILELCELGPRLVPAVDFGHLNALSGGALVDRPAFAAILELIQERLGRAYIQNLHIHFSPVEFTGAGEKKHGTTLDTNLGPDFAPLAEILVEWGLTPTIICESAGRQAEDAIVYRDIYYRLKEEKKKA
ncbi:putative endonuclease 4 [Pelotomaculum sp. FP]|nr:TIM barrel protein [Pelotomaculum sp. FP]TEB11003.1 putative endonuclease 4 [Pelotomaculum sp. FP]